MCKTCSACNPEEVIDDRAICVDCEVNTKLIGDYYMVRNYIWDTYGAGRRMLCIHCLEYRMDRELTADDFTEAPVNHADVVVLRSQTLLDRLDTF